MVSLALAANSPAATLGPSAVFTRKTLMRPSAQTTVIVRGKPNVLQAAGRDAGLKLMEIKRLREKGHKVTVLSDAQFWRLAAKR